MAFWPITERPQAPYTQSAAPFSHRPISPYIFVQDFRAINRLGVLSTISR